MAGMIVCPTVISTTVANWVACPKWVRDTRCHPAPDMSMIATCGMTSVAMVPVMIKCARLAIISRAPMCWWYMGVM